MSTKRLFYLFIISAVTAGAIIPMTSEMNFHLSIATWIVFIIGIFIFSFIVVFLGVMLFQIKIKRDENNILDSVLEWPKKIVEGGGDIVSHILFLCFVVALTSISNIIVHYLLFKSISGIGLSNLFFAVGSFLGVYSAKKMLVKQRK